MGLSATPSNRHGKNVPMDTEPDRERSVRVMTAPWGWYPDDINSKLQFDIYATPSPTDCLYVGLACISAPHVRNHIKKFKRSVYVNLEHPCTLYGSPLAGLDAIEQQALFEEVYTICPYTADWLNSLNVGTTFRAMPYPHNLEWDIYQNIEKVYEVAYCGLIHNEEIASYIEAIKSYNYFFSTLPVHNRVSSVNALATHTLFQYFDKYPILNYAGMASHEMLSPHLENLANPPYTDKSYILPRTGPAAQLHQGPLMASHIKYRDALN